MKKVFSLLAIVIALTIVSCKKELNPSQSKQGEVSANRPAPPPPPPSILQWQKCLGTSGEEFGNAVAKTSDGYFVAGYSRAATNGNNVALSNATVIKINLTGEVQKQENIGGSGIEEFKGIVATPDGGCLVVGITNSIDGDLLGQGRGSTDVLICKISSTGNKEWVKALGGSGSDAANAVIKTIDGGYALTGYTNSTDGDVTNSQVTGGDAIIWLVKFNITSTGPIIEWQKTIPNTLNKDGHGYSLVQTANGGYTMAGTVYTDPAPDIWVVNTDNTGSVNWQKIISSGTGSDVAFSLTTSTDPNNNINGYVISGYLSSVLAVIKLNLDGSDNWQKTFPAIGTHARSIVSTPQGDIVVGNNTNNSNDLFILRLDDANGEMISYYAFGGGKSDIGYSLITTADGGYITVGSTTSTNGDVIGNHGKSDMWVVKFKY